MTAGKYNMNKTEETNQVPEPEVTGIEQGNGTAMDFLLIKDIKDEQYMIVLRTRG